MLLKVKDVEEVLGLINREFVFHDKDTEEVDLADAVGRILAEDTASGYDIPDFNKSVVDGYAVKAHETFGSSEALPAFLLLAGEVKIGSRAEIPLRPGECVYVPTGGMIPDESDAVVMVENTEDLGGDSIAVYKPVSPWENTIKAGEDIHRGQQVCTKGTEIGPHHVGVLSSIGITRVKVLSKPRVSIISTGDEIVEPGRALKFGQIWDINSYSLSAAVSKDGGCPVIQGIVGDDRDEIKKRLLDALDTSDMVLVSGGSSAGFRDYTAGIINEIGDPGVLVHGISIKPGKPTIIGKVMGKSVVGMPGQPVSSLIVYRVIVSPLVRRLGGLPETRGSIIKARFRENYASSPGREEYLMVSAEESGNGWVAYPVYGKSGMITTISAATGMIKIPKNKEGLYRDEMVEIILL